MIPSLIQSLIQSIIQSQCLILSLILKVSACLCRLTAQFADVQHVSDDSVHHMLFRLPPAHLQGSGGERCDRQILRGFWEIGRRRDSETSASLVGPCAVLRDALIDGLIFSRDARHCQRAADQHTSSFTPISSY